MRSNILSLKKEVKELRQQVENLEKTKYSCNLSVLSDEELERLDFLLKKLPEDIILGKSQDYKGLGYYLTPEEHKEFSNILEKVSIH